MPRYIWSALYLDWDAHLLIWLSYRAFLFSAYITKNHYAYIIKVSITMHIARVLGHISFLYIFSFPDLSNGHSHLVHSFISSCWWYQGCTSSVRRGINIFYDNIFPKIGTGSIFILLQTKCFFYWCLYILFSFLFFRNLIVLIASCDLYQIRSIEMVHKRFESFPEALVKNLVSSQAKR